MSRECERIWEVDALREGRLSARDVDSFARHREECDECRARFDEDERIKALGRALPSPQVDRLHARRLRQSILRAAATTEEPSRAPRGIVFGALAACFVLAGVFAGWRLYVRPPVVSSNGANATTAPNTPIERPFGATIDPEAGAVWEARTEGLVERVRLTAGAIALTVRHREAGERFVVDLPDGEIEVRGTRFRVDVREGATRSVRVSEGLVAFRRFGAEEVLLAAGGSWPPIATIHVSESATTAVPTASARSLSPSRPSNRVASGHFARSSPSPSPPAATESKDDDSEYEAAVNLFSAQHYDEAARALHAFAIAHPDRAFADDAAFLEAIALARAGRPDAAAVVAERFLDRDPSSLQAPDAATLVARAARDRHDCARARSVAARWIAAPISRTAALGVCSEASSQ